jgi:hypothetical protein
MVQEDFELRQRASQKSPTICESWSRRSGRSWCVQAAVKSAAVRLTCYY